MGRGVVVGLGSTLFSTVSIFKWQWREHFVGRESRIVDPSYHVVAYNCFKRDPHQGWVKAGPTSSGWDNWLSQPPPSLGTSTSSPGFLSQDRENRPSSNQIGPSLLSFCWFVSWSSGQDGGSCSIGHHRWGLKNRLGTDKSINSDFILETHTNTHIY